MAKRTKAAAAEQRELLAQLREWIKPGDTVYTILDHVSASGMSRAIRVLVPMIDRHDDEQQPATVDFRHPNYAVGKVLGLRHWRRNGREQDALVVGGCGMDMGFHLVYELSHALYGSLRCEGCHKYPSGEYRTVIDNEFKADYNNQYPSCEYCGAALIGGYRCLGKGKCPSNYHNNHHDTVQCEGTRVYNPDGPDSGERCHWSREHGGWIIGGWEDGEAWQVCPTCKGKGRLPNPDGPERFDLVHTDGYALRHRWL